MFYTLVFFSGHVLCYWGMVYLYDDDKNILNKFSHDSFKNQILLTLPSFYIFFNYYPIKYDGFYNSLLYIPILIIFGDCYFYITHRPLHTKYLYFLHKQHHTGILNIAKSLDADFIEHIFGNIGSFLIGILILQYFDHIIHIYILFLWSIISVINVCVSHSNGGCFLDNKIHYNHHKYLYCNYGNGFYIMDRLFGSYRPNIS
jgi:sterol desaturase/sphingolipid hydroxylase (fatty acid hydroxylase superfamily)